MTSSIENLPPELFRHILIYLSPEDVSALSQTCHQMNSITYDDKIWEQFFRQRYAYSTCFIHHSNVEYLPDSALRITSPPEGCTWREYFIKRAFQDKHIRSVLNDIISHRKNRMANAENISSNYGLLAIDAVKNYFSPSCNFLKQSKNSVSLDSRNLTREYYSLDLARIISRKLGLVLLESMKNQRDIRTDGKALINALFVIQCFHPHGIFLSTNRLHSIGLNLKSDPLFSTLTTREKCQLILTRMRQENFLAANSGTEYYDLENSFISSAFSGKRTIPLTLVSIFCALAEECGILARPLGFPGEVMAQVEQLSDNSDPLIISVFDYKILTIQQLNERHASLLNAPLVYPLSITPINDLVIRSARNMVNSISRYTTSSLNSYGLYAAVSILKILGGGPIPFAYESMMNILKEHFPMDIHCFEMLSPTINVPNDDLDRIRNEDSNPSPIEEKRRKSSSPNFHVGQIFRHKQYNYWGLICGWDLKCTASPIWQVRMGIQDLSRGAAQPFYHILADDSSRRYVAEDNINASPFNAIQNPEEKYPILEALCSIDGIGKYFHTIDLTNMRFIPNEELLREYPDDFI